MKKIYFALIIVLSLCATVDAAYARAIRQSVPVIELADSTVKAVLRDSIVPISIENGYDVNKNMIVLKIYCTDKWYSVWPVRYYIDIEAIYSHTLNISDLKKDERYSGADFCGMEVEGIPVLVIDMTGGLAIRHVDGTVDFYYDPDCEVNGLLSNNYRYSISDRGVFLESYSVGGARYLDGYHPSVHELE